MKLCIFSPSDINYPEVDQSQPENQRENDGKCTETSGRQPEPGNSTASGRNNHQNQIDILKYKHIYGLKIIHMCICHYLDIKLFSDKAIPPNEPNESITHPPPIWKEILGKSLGTVN